MATLKELILCLAVAVVPAPAQQTAIVAQSNPAWPVASRADSDSPEHLMDAYYSILSGSSTSPRDWQRFRSLFLPESQMISIHQRPPEHAVAFTQSVEQRIALLSTNLAKADVYFKTKEIRTSVSGHVVNLWVSYEERGRPGDFAPLAVGTESVQIVGDGDRYWIAQIVSEQH